MGAVEPKIQVYTGAGQLLETLPWDGTRVVGLGFTWRDELAVVTDEGQVRLYALLDPSHAGADKARVEATPSTHYIVQTLGESAAEVGVASVQLLPTCAYALLRDGSVAQCFFPGVHDDYTTESPWVERGTPRPPVQYPVVPDAERISAWGVCAATHTVLLSTPEALYALEDGAYTPLPTDGPLDAICASPDGKLFALLTHDKQLLVVTADLQRTLRTWDVRTSEAYATCSVAPPIAAPLAEPAFAPAPKDKGGLGGTGITSIAWCGGDTVALAWHGTVHVVGPVDDPLTLSVRGATYLQGDASGLQMLHAEAHEYLDKVPAASEAALRPGSTHVSTILLDASQLAQRSSPRAYEAVQAIQHDLVPAVETCIAAASQAWDVHTQQKLLKAALFGKTFVDVYDTASYLQVARTLRVLNAVRDYRIGIPAQYAALHDDGVSMLLYRLCVRHQHHTAERICSYLQVRADQVLKHWARAKVAHARPSVRADDDASLAQVIIAKFEAAGALNYAEIALTAWQAGRARLATVLLDHEARAIGQVPLLLHMREHRLALQRAVECGDSDLIYYVLFRLQQRMSRGEFFRIVQAPLQAPEPRVSGDTVGVRPPSEGTYTHLAACLLERYAREQDKELLRDFYFLDDRRVDQGLLSVSEAPRDAQHVAERVHALRDAAKHFAEDREHVQDARLCEEGATLLGFQAGLDKELAGMGVRPSCGSLVGLPLAKTIEVCVQHGLYKRAERLKHDYKMPERVYFAVKMQALIAMADWKALAGHVGRRPPGGLEPVVSALLQAGQLNEACHYCKQGAHDKSSRNALQALIERCPVEETKTRLLAALHP